MKERYLVNPEPEQKAKKKKASAKKLPKVPSTQKNRPVKQVTRPASY